MGLQKTDNNRCLWSDFGGKTETSDSTTWNTACRENKEENLDLQTLSSRDFIRIYRIIHYIKYRRSDMQYLKLYYIYIIDAFESNEDVITEFKKKRLEPSLYNDKEKLCIKWINIQDNVNFNIFGYRCRDCLALLLHLL